MDCSEVSNNLPSRRTFIIYRNLKRIIRAEIPSYQLSTVVRFDAAHHHYSNELCFSTSVFIIDMEDTYVCVDMYNSRFIIFALDFSQFDFSQFIH